MRRIRNVFFYLLLSGVLSLSVLCRLAAGGEGGTFTGGDPTGSIFRLLTDFGALGAFIAYLIWQRKRDVEKADSDSKRWHALDRELVGLVERCTKALAESTAVMTEIRMSIHENTRELRRLNTRVYKRDETDTE